MVYFIYNGTHIKIGYSKNVERRLKQLNTGSSNKLTLIGCLEGNKKTEKELHDRFSYLRANLEWFNINDDLIEYINNNNIMLKWIEAENNKLMIYSKMSVV